SEEGKGRRETNLGLLAKNTNFAYKNLFQKLIPFEIPNMATFRLRKITSESPFGKILHRKFPIQISQFLNVPNSRLRDQSIPNSLRAQE
ncbi:hypothetical protein, partial [Bacteroides sp. CAG:633]|uniref:hypothetical protein n=1 Tax=Bacteroides sp. CAG:633 TaxID=1262744 RepID=UPI002587AD30